MFLMNLIIALIYQNLIYIMLFENIILWYILILVVTIFYLWYSNFLKRYPYFAFFHLYVTVNTFKLRPKKEIGLFPVTSPKNLG